MLKLLITVTATAKNIQSYVKYGVDLANRKAILDMYDLSDLEEGITIEFDGINTVVIDEEKERMLQKRCSKLKNIRKRTGKSLK